MKKRIAKVGEYILNLNTGDVKQATFVLEDGTAAVNEFYPVHDHSTELIPIHWEVNEYQVLEEYDAL